MSSGNTSTTQPPHPSQIGGGLILTGTVIAVRTEEKEWEKVKYIQTTLSISDGEQVTLMRHRHDGKPFIVPKLFETIRVRVTRASTDKGQITVGGLILA
jgi:hypothetical protein